MNHLPLLTIFLLAGCHSAPQEDSALPVPTGDASAFETASPQGAAWRDDAPVLAVRAEFIATATELLGSNDEDEREWAAHALAALGPLAHGSVPGLLRALGDEDEDVRDASSLALERIAPVDELVALLESDDRNVRMAVLGILGHIGAAAKPAVPRIARCLDNVEEDVRDAALQALKLLGSEARAAAPKLVSRLADPDLINSMAEALETIDPDARAAGLVGLLSSSDANVRYEAIYLLGATDNLPLTAVLSLAAVLEDPEPDVREAVVEGLYGLGASAAPAASKLVHALEDEAVRKRAKRSLQSLGQQASAATPELIALLDHPDPALRVLAADLLATTGQDSSTAISSLLRVARTADGETRAQARDVLDNLLWIPVATLIESIESPSPAVRLWALGHLEGMGPAAEPAIASLIAVFASTDIDSDESGTASSALINIGAPSVPALVQALEDPDQGTRLWAVTTLGWMRHESALPALIGVTRAEETEVREATRMAITNILYGDDLRNLVQSTRALENRVQMLEGRMQTFQTRPPAAVSPRR